MSSSFKLIILIALAEEAKPLINALGLKKKKDSALTAYENAYILLVISGIGIYSMHSAVGYAAGLQPKEKILFWLNVGTAGHSDHDLGSIVIPAAIKNLETNLIFFTTPVLSGTNPVDNLITVTKTNQQYPKNLCQDMEASGFCHAASRFSLIDYIQVVKVISDNRQHPIKMLRKGDFGHAISKVLDKVLVIIEHYLKFAAEEVEQKANRRLFTDLDGIYFTETQKLHLKRLCFQLQALDTQLDIEKIFRQEKKSSAILEELANQIKICQSELIND